MTSEIKFQIELDQNRVPEKIMWTAEDGGVALEETKAILLSVWDSKSQETLRIDLWTKEMMVDEMADFYYQLLMTMADTFNRATNQQVLADDMKLFAKDFLKKFKDLQLKENQSYDES